MSEAFEQKVLRNVIFLEARAKGIQEELISELLIVFRRLMEEIKSTDDFDSRSRAVRISEEIRRTLGAVYDSWGQSLTEEVQKAVEVTFAGEHKVLIKEFQIDEQDFFQLPLPALSAIVESPVAGGLISTWASKLSDKQSSAIKKSLIQSVSEGLGSEEAAKRLREDGALLLTRREADIIARTSMLQSANRVRAQMLDSYKKYIPSYRYVATLDSRTCVICAPYDGMTKKKRRNLPDVPRHPRCRCTVVAWDKEEIDPEATRPSVIHESQVVKHRDGSTSTRFKVRSASPVHISTTYSEWFKSQPKSFQKRVLGAGRFKLYESGKLQLKDFATPKRIKTVKELQEAVEEE